MTYIRPGVRKPPKPKRERGKPRRQKGRGGQKGVEWVAPLRLSLRSLRRRRSCCCRRRARGAVISTVRCRCVSICACKVRPRPAAAMRACWISASGAITADTPHDFENFAQGRDLAGATVVLDSDGGSVHGAIALGREIRRLGLDTTVGRLVDLDGAERGQPARQLLAARRLRIDVRLRAARRRAPHGAAGGARDGAPDLARRPPRRSDRGELFGRRPGAGAARYRPARAIHRRHGRLHRTARSGAAHSALGADARA